MQFCSCQKQEDDQTDAYHKGHADQQRGFHGTKDVPAALLGGHDRFCLAPGLVGRRLLGSSGRGGRCLPGLAETQHSRPRQIAHVGDGTAVIVLMHTLVAGQY